MVRQILDRGHYEILVDDNKDGTQNVSIRNKFYNCEELYDENLDDDGVKRTITEIESDAK